MGTAKMSFMKLVIIQMKLGIATHFKLFLDPNSCRFTLVISIFGFVLKFMKSLKRRSRKLPSDDQYKNILLLDEEIEVSQTFFFFQKATIEIKTFVRTSHYQQISIEKNGILYYTWRILPTEKIQAANEMTEVIKDLCSSTFCVLLVYKHRPFAYSFS